MKKKLLGYYDYTVVLTYCGMLSAFAGILKAIGECYQGAVLFLMFAGLCDMFDGAVASTKDRSESEKCFGIQIDSLSDLIAFGVLPGIFVYMIEGQTLFAGVVSGFYVLCALIRLGYFNVMETERQSQTEERRTMFLGVPVTTIAVALPVIYLFYSRNAERGKAVFCALLAVTAIGFLIPVKIRKPQKIGKICLIVIGLAEACAVLLFLMPGRI